MNKPHRLGIWTIPNILTFIRILAVPVVVYWIGQGVIDETYSLWALILFTLAIITDQIDGYIARALKQQTTLGEILDPIADKLIVLCVLIQFVWIQVVPSWVVMLILSREIYINGLRAFSQSRGLAILPSLSGKLKVYFQGFGIGFLMLCNYSVLSGFPMHRIGMALLYLSLALSIFSAWDYSHKMVKHVQQSQ